MKEHPILFTGPMVRAILEGRKTQTRRPIKAPKGLTIGCREGSLVAFDDEGGPTCVSIKAPFVVGDRLWVRETFSYLTTTEERHYNDMEGRSRCSEYDRVLTPNDFTDGPWEDGPAGPIAYKASHSDEEIKSWDVHREMWRPSIHMPRWASRLTLEVTDIRPERVKDITEADAISEGCRFFPDLPPDPKFRPSGPHCRWSMYEPKTDAQCLGSAAFAFGNAWNHIYGDGPFAWTNNPWTWATTFKVVTP